VIRGVALALVCCGLPLYGHPGARDVDRGSAIGVVVLLLLGIGFRMAARQMSFLRLTALLVTGQLAMHALLEVTVERRVPGEIWTYHPHAPPLPWISDAPGAGRMLAMHLLLDLGVAAVLYGCECNVWAWFRIAALRMLAPAPPAAIPPTPEAPVLQPVDDAPSFPPLLWVSASGRRGPPLSLTC
jgi:hypothetical protein